MGEKLSSDNAQVENPQLEGMSGLLTDGHTSLIRDFPVSWGSIKVDTPMIDTIRFQIPLTPTQHTKALHFVSESDRWHWAMHNPKHGEILVRHYAGELPRNSPSYHREIRFSLSPKYYEGDCFLTVECSLPKAWYGHNIKLLYSWKDALEEIRNRFNKCLQLHSRSVLPPIKDFIINRLDCCYAWKFPNQSCAQSFLDSLKSLKFPRKSTVIYPTSIFFRGSTYSFKFYLKYPEFRKHDMQEMIKQRIDESWIEYLEHSSLGVLRCEATLRSKYLRRNGVKTVDDLMQAVVSVDLRLKHDGSDSVEIEDSRLNQVAAITAISQYLLDVKKIDPETRLSEGMVLEVPEPIIFEFGDYPFPFPPMEMTIGKKVGKPTSLLQDILHKFIGTQTGMNEEHKVKEALLAKYTPNKAASLLGFWLIIRKMGVQEARDMYGKHPYYRNLRSLRDAGVSLVDKPQAEETNLVFLDAFRLEIPSPFVVNQFDDFRDGANLLNLSPDSEAAQA